METKTSIQKKEKTATTQPTEKFYKDMFSEFMSLYKQQLNLAIELSDSIGKSISSIPSVEKMPVTTFYKTIFSSEQMEKPVFSSFLKMDGQQEAAEKLLKEISDVYHKQLDISIETNKELFSELNNQIKKVIKTNEELLHLDEVMLK